MKSALKSLVRTYSSAAIIILNTIILFALLNWLAGALMGSYHSIKYDRMISQSWPALHRAYPNYSKEDVRALMLESLDAANLSYAPWVQFRAPTINGRFYNTANMRRSNGVKGNWATAMPDGQHLDVYVFGGSTAFGFGVADNETLSASIERLAPSSWKLRTFNYGQPYYYSRQETQLFEQLVRNGHRPDVAIFVDGLNDMAEPTASFRREPFFTPLMERRVASPIDWQTAILNLNVVRTLKTLGLAPNALEKNSEYYAPPPGVSTEMVIDTVLGNYLENETFTQKLCDIYRVRCLFIWQPIPNVDYKRPEDTLSSQGSSDYISGLYGKVAALHSKPDNFMDLQNTLSDFKGQPFVDIYHYSPGFHVYLAGKILERIEKLGSPPGK